jgi:hypothetical protein
MMCSDIIQFSAALDRVTVQFGLAPQVDHEWITITTAKIWCVLYSAMSVLCDTATARMTNIQ